MSNQSRWLVYLSASKLEAHKQWVKAGFTGTGRLIVSERNLSKATIPGVGLMSAKFVKCKIVEPDLSEQFNGSKVVSPSELFELWGLRNKPNVIVLQ